MTPAYDHDAFMRLHVLAGGRVTVTRPGSTRLGQLIEWRLKLKQVAHSSSPITESSSSRSAGRDRMG